MNYINAGADQNHKEAMERYAQYIEYYVCNGYSVKKTSEKFGVHYCTVLKAISRYFKREEHDMVLKSKIWDEQENLTENDTNTNAA